MKRETEVADTVHTHDTDRLAQAHAPISWVVRETRADDPVAYPFRQCSYCGSIHPVDLLALLGEGATLELSNTKSRGLGTLYVQDIPNPRAGGMTITYAMCASKPVDSDGWEEYDTGRRVTGTGEVEKAWRSARGTHDNPKHVVARFVTNHLLDLSHEDGIELSVRIIAHTGIIIRHGKPRDTLLALDSAV